MRRLGAFGRVRLNTQRTQLLLLQSTATRVQQFQKTTEQSEKRLTRYVTVLPCLLGQVTAVMKRNVKRNRLGQLHKEMRSRMRWVITTVDQSIND